MLYSCASPRFFDVKCKSKYANMCFLRFWFEISKSVFLKQNTNQAVRPLVYNLSYGVGKARSCLAWQMGEL